jgi:hypothetical protein
MALGMSTLAAIGLIGQRRLHPFSTVFAAIGFAGTDFAAARGMRTTLMGAVAVVHIGSSGSINDMMFTRVSLNAV